MAIPDVYIRGIGSKLGSNEVAIEDVARQFQLTAAELKNLRRKCGPNRLFKCADGERIEDCAAEACRLAVRNAGLTLSDVDGIYASTGGPISEYMLPDLPRTIAQDLGLADIDTVEVSMGCVGGIDCMLAASHRLIVDRLKGRTSHYLVVCGDQTEATHAESDRSTAFLFSDGMACFVMSNEAENGYRVDAIDSVSAGGDPYCMNLKNLHHDPDAKFEMNGTAVYEFVVKTALPQLHRMLGLDMISIDAYCIFHQASLSILRQLAAQAEISDDRMYYDGIREFGNTSGATVMFGLEDAIKKDYVWQASQVVIAAFGVGLKVGGMLLSPVGDPRQIIDFSHQSKTQGNAISGTQQRAATAPVRQPDSSPLAEGGVSPQPLD